MKVYDLQGNERDWAWVQATYGNVMVLPPPFIGPEGWYVTELREVEGAATYRVHCPAGTNVARWWPSVTKELPAEFAWGPGEKERWQATGIVGAAEAKEEGDYASYGGGPGDNYFLPNQGASWFFLPGNSGCVRGIGFLGGTEHRHLDMTFTWGKGKPEPPSEPETYTLTVDVVGDGIVGFSAPSPYEAGTKVLVKATARTGSHFDRWLGDIISTDPIIELIMDGDKVLTAHFVQDEPPPGPGPDYDAAAEKALQIIELAQGAYYDIKGEMP